MANTASGIIVLDVDDKSREIRGCRRKNWTSFKAGFVPFATTYQRLTLRIESLWQYGAIPEVSEDR
jgi:hypothetical protein